MREQITYERVWTVDWSTGIWGGQEDSPYKDFDSAEEAIDFARAKFRDGTPRASVYYSDREVKE